MPLMGLLQWDVSATSDSSSFEKRCMCPPFVYPGRSRVLPRCQNSNLHHPTFSCEDHPKPLGSSIAFHCRRASAARTGSSSALSHASEIVTQYLATESYLPFTDIRRSMALRRFVIADGTLSSPYLVFATILKTFAKEDVLLLIQR